jgi:hypothetical protein
VLDVEELPRHEYLVVQQVIGKDDRKWAFRDERHRTKNSVPKPKRV